jgi:hypothetical protein
LLENGLTPCTTCAATKILFESIRAREGFFMSEVTNESDAPAHVFIQLNKSDFYGGSGLVGIMIKLVSNIFRMSRLSLEPPNYGRLS